MEEIWRDIEGYENIYQISNLGRIKSFKGHEKILKPRKDGNGYLQVDLCKSGKIKKFLIHRLVAIAFILNPKNKPCVNHIDGNKENNCIDNLEWCTVQENNIHAFKTNLKKPAYKPLIAINLTTGEEMQFKSQKEASEKLNLKRPNISNVLKGKQKKTGNYTFKHIDKKQEENTLF